MSRLFKYNVFNVSPLVLSFNGGGAYSTSVQLNVAF